jgi:trehalose 6-phosphate phosphatase
MTRASGAISHLFSDWKRIADHFRRSKRLVIFLDFDGTLAQIAPTPDRARLEDGARESLQKLARHENVAVVVISGRRRAELLAFVGLPELKYLGLYGWEDNGKKTMPFRVRLELVGLLLDLHSDFQNYGGVRIEPKGNSFSVHLLGASAGTKQRVLAQLKKRLSPLRKTLKVMRNLRDLEVAPVLIGDKGIAVRKFLSARSHRGALPIYFGDDFSDEPAFAAVRTGIPILVGERRPTRARYLLRGPAEVADTLSKMEELIRWREQKRPSNSLPFRI